ncbi:class I SAM-dependent methyltransferase [Methanocella arvoryzae]|uniref:SAM-dependent methyltransferase n=1 Tax=Methanocella arvoryzae (strain DSM 22066 / NBRC 105507 / MRE50) TaxID=351160 RepID=Q0W6G1_METAR|nr:class I SAM-dependent methyltransferase [Methanocella arvoryzae]CAJ36032.1 putative SAM-dependent methyltransferase [Methanocella arvoryzae MRE50]
MPDQHPESNNDVTAEVEYLGVDDETGADLERKAELDAIADSIRQTLKGRRVLEVACGTGYWTKIAAEVAAHVVALDISPKMLAVAQSRALPPESVEFCVHDAYELASVQGSYDAGLAIFWLSHVPRDRVEKFLGGFHNRLGEGSVVFMADRLYTPKTGGTLMVKRGSPDTFRLRRMPDGSMGEIIVNYYDDSSLQPLLALYAEDLEISAGESFWWLRYRVKNRVKNIK